MQTYRNTINSDEGIILTLNPEKKITKVDRNSIRAEPNETGKGISYHESNGNKANISIDIFRSPREFNNVTIVCQSAYRIFYMRSYLLTG